jgi:hypothetical protein
VKSDNNNEAIVALLQQLLAQNEALAREVATLKAQLKVIENKLDWVAEEAGAI